MIAGNQFAHLHLHINCLADENHGIRNKGLRELDREIPSMAKDSLIRLFTDTKLTSFLAKTIADSKEMNREAAIKLVEILIQKTGDDGKNLY